MDIKKITGAMSVCSIIGGIGTMLGILFGKKIAEEETKQACLDAIEEHRDEVLQSLGLDKPDDLK